MARTLIRVPATATRGEVIEIRTLIQHPMETGYRPDAAGRLLVRDIITRFTCHFDNRLVFEAMLHSAIAANPYLTFTALLLAGLDGIENRIDPGPAMDKNLYDLPAAEQKSVPEVCGSLREALECLDKDRAFLKKGGVMDDDFIDSYIELKMEEVRRFEITPHPVEFDMYYSL